ncbi:hypothetical protein DFH09DRAFT_931200, partial [Mycena vulgaris]
THDFLGLLPLFLGTKVMVLENVVFIVDAVHTAEGTVKDVNIQWAAKTIRSCLCPYPRVWASCGRFGS